jgi:hypothetical protein
VTVLAAPSELTAEFLTAAMQEHVPGASVTDFRCEPLVGVGGLAGNLVRIRLRGDGPVLPGSVILKTPPVDPPARAQLTLMGFFEREVGFYQHLAAETPVHTPICYSSGFDPDTGAAFLLLEDLTSARLVRSASAGTVEDVAAVLAVLARMHARWWQDQALTGHAWLTLRSMGAPSAVTEVFEQSWPSFVSKLSIPVDDEVLAMKAWISSSLEEASLTLFETGPRTLTHDDIQGDNLLFPDDPDRPVVLLDWQFATCARGAVDVASAIRGSLVPELRRSAEADLLRGYHEALVRAGVQGYSLARCRADYDLAGVIAPARVASAVGVIPVLEAHPGAFWDTLFLRYRPS